MFTHLTPFRRSPRSLISLLCGLSLFSGILYPVGNTVLADSSGRIIEVSGKVEILAMEETRWKTAETGQAVRAGESLRTGREGTASLLLADETQLRLNRSTELTIAAIGQPRSRRPREGGVPSSPGAQRSLYRLPRGEAWMRNKHSGIEIDVETPLLTAQLTHTELNFAVIPNQSTRIAILEGRIRAENRFGAITAAAGSQVIAQPGTAPRSRLLVRPADAVQWTISLPPDFPISDVATPLPDRGAPAKGHAPDKVSVQVRSAQRDLANGNAREARDSLVRITAQDPGSASAWRALSLSALVLGDNQQAARAARKATEIEPDSASSLIVRSYVQQASFELDEAKTSIVGALALDAENLTALLSLARLQFGNDEVEAARNTIETAGGMAPDNAQVLSLRGFIDLGLNRTNQAISDFVRAAERDPAFADPHLGLALALMRQGNTADALKEIGVAVLLAPQRSLFVSYWGKLLHQAERFAEALDVLGRAKELDPLDPTPDLYRAVILRDLNRPGEAIAALNRSIKLNGNRAVFRSRLLLDQDLATRNVDLSILYNQLGLGGWARTKALASIESDYTNWAAHLFYAGALSTRGDRSYPFNSETLLARMLQPANLNTFNNYNNYTSLFEQPSRRGTLSAAAGNQEALAGDITAFGAWPMHNLAFSATGFYADSAGWRGTNFERLRGTAVLTKWQPTPRDGLLFSASYTNPRQGGADFPRFESDGPERPRDRLESQLRRFELGYHRKLDPGTHLLLYVSKLGSDIDAFRRDEVQFSFPDGTTVPGSIDSNTAAKRPFHQAQAQLMKRFGQHQLILGALLYQGKFNGNRIENWAAYSGEQAIPLQTLTAGDDLSIHYHSYYLVDQWTPTPGLNLEVAAYYDRLDNADPFQATEWTVSDFNPRIGLIWRPSEQDTLRLAAFRYILPFISPRLDPTSIAGTPIFRNTEEGSSSTEVSATWEHEWAKGLWSINAFHLQKTFESELNDGGGRTRRTSDSGRRTGLELEWNQLVTNGLGLNGRYLYQQVVDERTPSSDRDEHLISIGLSYVRSLGHAIGDVSRGALSAGITLGFRWLDLKHGRENDQASVTDLSVGYQLPRRRGAATLQVLNLFDNEFNWVTDRYVFKGRAPARQILLSMSINF